MNTNGLKFENADIEHAKGLGSIPKLTFDDDITVEPIARSSPMAPTHGVLGCSPRCRPVECGGIWDQRNRDIGADHFLLTIRVFGINANPAKLQIERMALFRRRSSRVRRRLPDPLGGLVFRPALLA